jgi:2-C-methyl-D-erythritol 2,4-cyclodiphosphate synthase
MENKFDAVILAAGHSVRMGIDKMSLPLGESFVLTRTVSKFAENPFLNKIILVGNLNPKDFQIYKDKILFAEGGETRAESSENGLKLAEAPYVLIHDGARPFVSENLIDDVFREAVRSGSAVPALPISDSVRKIKNGEYAEILDRNSLYAVQTPQGFYTPHIKKAYAKRKGAAFSDDAEVYSKYISPAKIIAGEERNKKITTPGDYFGLNSRVGFGYDIHGLAPFKKLVLGGIEIASDTGAIARSDGDALIHALIDALLSAAGKGDIGTYFPDADPRYDGIDSSILLSKTMEIYKKEGLSVNNAALTIVLDSPKLQDYIPLMKLKLSRLLDIRPSDVGIAAKTSEKTNPEVVEAYAVITVN